ncbi:hypothetical protein GCM10023188_37670 [Pontibacter saemangeumensis]|uniref:Uncharacterized protein n=1 Tax=Pontibacter saemangeumensis TaxID=1084525 RepID=A0ABP8LZQ1_9BACT
MLHFMIPGTIGSGTIGSGTIGSGTIGSGTIGSGTIGSGTIGQVATCPYERRWRIGFQASLEQCPPNDI